MTEKTLETLKDIKIGAYCGACGREDEASLEPVRTLAIKWVKEDKKVLKIISPLQHRVFDGLTKLWMKRLNISEEDLK